MAESEETMPSAESIKSPRSITSDVSESSSKSHALVRHNRARKSPRDSNYYYAKKVSESTSLNVSSSKTGYDPLYDPSLTHESSGSVLHSAPHSAPNSARTSLSPSSIRFSTDPDNKRTSIFHEMFDKPPNMNLQDTDLSDSSKDGSETTKSKVMFSSHLSQHSYSSSSKDIKTYSLLDEAELLKEPETLSLWTVYCRLVTIAVCSWMLNKCGIQSKAAQNAWREKIGLLSIIGVFTIMISFFAFGFNSLLCDSHDRRIHFQEVDNSSVIIHGRVLNLTGFTHEYYDPQSSVKLPPLLVQHPEIGGKDVSFLFQNVNWNCHGLIEPRVRNTVPKTDDMYVSWYFPCRVLGVVNDLYDIYADHLVQDQEVQTPYRRKKINEIKLQEQRNRAHLRPRDLTNGTDASDFSAGAGNSAQSVITSDAMKKPDFRARGYGCHISTHSRQKFYNMPTIGDAVYTWDDVLNDPGLVVINQNVVDLDRLEYLDRRFWKLDALISLPLELEELPADLSHMFASSSEHRRAGRCLVELAKVGIIDSETMGCLASQAILYLSLIFIVTIVMTKFLFALYFEWFLSPRMISENDKDPKTNNAVPPSETRASHPFSRPGNDQASAISLAAHNETSNPPGLETKAELNNDLMKVICLVTVYRESMKGLRQCFDALASTLYPNSNKVLVVVCDGMVSVSDDASTLTYEQVLSLMEPLNSEKDHCMEDNLAYASVGRGKEHINMAAIYYGVYRPTKKEDKEYEDGASTTISAGSTSASSSSEGTEQSLGIICIVKKGNPQEKSNKGNRGKRDSQVMLMSFLEKVLLNERMSDFQNELYYAFVRLCRFEPSNFDALMMVDADTKVYPDSLALMTSCLTEDPYIMGICGETMIENKTESWVSMIQVFEYFISHHLNKSFESVFGGVTCLPGCFSMYRIKTFKKTHHWLPILVNPDVVIRYSVNQVDSLHLKNLLLLGEDRYLSTLMLKTFPRRKLIFLPKAKCTTVVPASFHVLIDQRRRWINSTVHNLLELMLVDDLCGVFCISMQVVVVIELLGTITLPAAFVFFFYLVITSAYSQQPIPVIPLTLLICIIGVPGLLILVTTKDWRFFVWMLVYLCSLPVWNLILPLNACEYPGISYPRQELLYITTFMKLQWHLAYILPLNAHLLTY